MNHNTFDWHFLLSPLLWVLSLVLALFLAILGNILTPHVMNWQAKWSKQRAEKRINNIRAELAFLKNIVDDQKSLLLLLYNYLIYIFVSIFTILFIMTILIYSIGHPIMQYTSTFSKKDSYFGITPDPLITILYYFNPIVISIIVFVTFFILFKFIKIITKIIKYQEYKTEMEVVIKGLELISSNKKNNS